MYSRATLVLLMLLISAGSAQAGPTLYVRSTGNDKADGLSPVTALRSIRVAAKRIGDGGAGSHSFPPLLETPCPTRLSS